MKNNETKNLSKAELILHPVRLRIISTLAGSDGHSGLELTELLPDIAQATLYRHLNALHKGGILRVAEERAVRGAVEKRFRLEEGAAVLGPNDLKEATAEDHMRFFSTFVASLMNDFGRYLDQPEIDLVRDGAGYRQIPLHQNDEEFSAFTAELSKLVRKEASNPPSPERKRRLLSTILIPDPPVQGRGDEKREENDHEPSDD